VETADALYVALCSALLGRQSQRILRLPWVATGFQTIFSTRDFCPRRGLQGLWTKLHEPYVWSAGDHVDKILSRCKPRRI